MNKSKFLSELRKKLKVLSEEEKNDIINEYDDIITEKVKHGKTEEEAVIEFGNIDDLVKEILKAYKINPNYSNNIVDDCEKLIQKGAKKLEEATNEIIDTIKNDEKIKSSSAFEIIIKVLVLLFILWLIKIPFSIIEGIAINIIGINTLFSSPFKILFETIINILYFIFCIYIVYVLIVKNKQNSHIKKKSSTSPDNLENSYIYNQKDEIKESKSKNDKDSLEKILILLIKIWCFILFIIPLIFIQLGLIVCICILIWLMTKGITIYGIMILIIGFIIIFGVFSSLLNRFIFNKKINVVPVVSNVIIGIIAITFGFLLTTDYIISLDKYNTVPDNIKKDIYIYTGQINDKTKINYDNIIIDDSLDNNIRIEVEYYKKYVDIYINHGNDYSYCEYERCSFINSIIVHTKYTDNMLKKYTNLFFDNLKENKIYNYSKLNDYKVTIYVSSKTKDLIV